MISRVSDQAPSLGFAWLAATLIGFATVAWVGALDVMISLSEEPASFGLASWLLWLAMGVCVVPLIALAAALLIWPVRRSVSRSVYVGLLTGCALQVLALLHLGNMLALMSVGPVWLAGLLVARARDIHMSQLLASLAAACTLAAGITVLFVFTVHPSPLAWGTVAVATMVAACAAARSALARYPVSTPYLLSVSVLVLIVSCLGASFATADQPAAHAPEHRAALPNVVLIVLDTTRRDHLGAYGHTGNLTPNLDRLAADATIYETAISPADWTAPSHASLFTGWFPATHGVSFAHHRWLDDGFQTLAELLKQEGFQTVGLAANRYLHITNLHQGFDHYVLTWSDRGSYLVSAAQLLGFPDRWVDKGAQRTVDELGRWMSEFYNPSQPLFLFVNLLEAHWRYMPPLAERTRELPADVPYWRATRVSAGFHPIHWLAGQPHSETAERAIRGLYAAEVAYQDQQLGRFFAALRRRIDLDHTLLIITADHGENLGEGARWDHTFAVNDQLVHVPLIIRYPGGAQAGRRIGGQCQTIDILPTIFTVLGRALPVHGLPGRSLLPDQFQPHGTAFTESVPFFDHAQRLSNVTGMRRDIARFTRVLRAARREPFKYVVANDGSEMLFDLVTDPDEATDVAAAHPDVVRELRAELTAWQRDLPRYAAVRDDDARTADDQHSPGLSEAERERLRQLGYMQ